MLLTHHNTEVIFGSEFPMDQSDLQISLNLQKIKTCMAAGKRVVLVHCEQLYESLYDLLNQHYISVKSQNFVRIAFGSHSRLCPIHAAFRIICIVDKHDAYTKLAPPLLNRFEKQVLERTHLLGPAHERLLTRLRGFVQAMIGCAHTQNFCVNEPEISRRLDFFVRVRHFSSKCPCLTFHFTSRPPNVAKYFLHSVDGAAASLADTQHTFCGFHSDSLPSIAQAVVGPLSAASSASSASATGAAQFDAWFAEAVERLLWVAMPQAVSRVIADTKRAQALKDEFKTDLYAAYFERQSHSNVVEFARHLVQSASGAGRTDTMLLTHAPYAIGVQAMLEAATSAKVALCALHELSSERDLKKEVDLFFEAASKGKGANTSATATAKAPALFVLQCDPSTTSLRRIQHARYILDNARAQHCSASCNESGDHVCFVILMHLARDDAMFAFDFDRRWRYAYVDTVDATTGADFPPLSFLMKASMPDIIGKLRYAGRCINTPDSQSNS